MGRKVITEVMVRAAGTGGTLEVPKDAILTPSARDAARHLKVTLTTPSTVPGEASRKATSGAKPGAERKIAIGADHGGYPLKEKLKKYLATMQYQTVDVGTNSPSSVDYPDFAHAVARLVADGDCQAGIMIDGAGIGSCMVANKVPGIRAAMCYDISTAVNSREHNNANVLTLGARLIGDLLAEQIVKVWLGTSFEGGRHQGRVDKIAGFEGRYLKGS